MPPDPLCGQLQFLQSRPREAATTAVTEVALPATGGMTLAESAKHYRFWVIALLTDRGLALAMITAATALLSLGRYPAHR